MKPFTSELYIKTSALTDERVCIGLFAISASEKHFAYSSRKLRIAKNLLSEEVYKGLEHSLKSMEKEINRLGNPSLLSLEKDKFTRHTFDYLNRYSKGVLSFTAPRPVALDMSEDSFKRLFSKLVDKESDKKLVEKSNFKKKVSKVLKREAFDKVDRSYTVTPELITDIYINHEIDFIGKNGSVLAGKSIDFNSTRSTIENHLLEYTSIIRGLNRLIKARSDFDKKAEFYAYFEMPEDEDSRKLLDLAKRNKDKGFELLELDELHNTADRIERGPYTKFSTAISV